MDFTKTATDAVKVNAAVVTVAISAVKAEAVSVITPGRGAGWGEKVAARWEAWVSAVKAAVMDAVRDADAACSAPVI